MRKGVEVVVQAPEPFGGYFSATKARDEGQTIKGGANRAIEIWRPFIVHRIVPLAVADPLRCSQCHKGSRNVVPQRLHGHSLKTGSAAE